MGIKRPNMKSHTILQIQGSVLICWCASCMFCTAKLITNCPGLSLGPHVPYGEKTLGASRHCQPPAHSAYLRKGVRVHLRWFLDLPSWYYASFSTSLLPTHLPGYGFPAGVFLIAPSRDDPLAPTALQPLSPVYLLLPLPSSCDNLIAPVDHSFPSLSFIAECNKQVRTEKNLGQSCEPFDVVCAKSLSASLAASAAFCSVTVSV